MKKFTFKGVLDGFRSSVAQPARVDQEIVETLRPENFQVAKTFRHGFPFQPTALAFDPIQHLLAVGTKSGSLRMYPFRLLTWTHLAVASEANNAIKLSGGFPNHSKRKSWQGMHIVLIERKFSKTTLDICHRMNPRNCVISKGKCENEGKRL